MTFVSKCKFHIKRRVIPAYTDYFATDDGNGLVKVLDKKSYDKIKCKELL